MDRTKTITIDTEKELYNILPEMIEPKRKGKSGVKTREYAPLEEKKRLDDTRPKTREGDTRPKMEVPQKQKPKGYRIGGRVKLAKRGGGRAYGKNS